MLQSIRQLYGSKLGASDGEIGQVQDFYFDDRSWVVRYVVANTGSWLPGRQGGLSSPHAFGHGLTPFGGKGPAPELGMRKQIEEIARPSALHKASVPAIRGRIPITGISAGHSYWRVKVRMGCGARAPFRFWICRGCDGFRWRKPLYDRARPAIRTRRPAHLRSTQAVNGYHLQASDGTTGHVCDFINRRPEHKGGPPPADRGNRPPTFRQRGADPKRATVHRISYERIHGVCKSDRRTPSSKSCAHDEAALAGRRGGRLCPAAA